MSSDPNSPSAENESSILRDYVAQSDLLLVSFSGLKRNPEKMPGFSMRGTAAGLEVKKLYLRDLHKAWFLRGLRGVTSNVEETVDFLSDEIASVGARRVVFIGYSLGGFAALLYGALCGAHEVHAISPQTFITFWNRWGAGDYRWRRYVLPMYFNGTRRYHDLRPWLAQRSQETVHHVYYARDSLLDAAHAAHISDLPAVISHPSPQGSHRLVTEMRESGELRSILERAVAGDHCA